MRKKVIIFILWGIFMGGCRYKTINDYSSETYNSNDKIPYKYNIYRDLRGYDDTTVLYYLHGFKGNENSWYDSNKTIISEWRKAGKPSPVVVGISFGEEWLLFPKNPKKEKSGYLEYFVNDVMPSVERHIGKSVVKRYIMGFSQGGGSAAQLIFRYPELFEKGVLVSPNIFPISVYSKSEEIEEFIRIENSRMPGFKHWIMKNVFMKDRLRESVYYHFAKYKIGWIPDQKTWDEIDIIKNMKQLPPGEVLRVYISCGETDLNGFYPGAEKLSLKARSLSYNVIWKPLSGGHLVSNQKEIAAFLME